MQYCISDGILKHNRTKTFLLAGKAVGTGIHNPCNWQIFPCVWFRRAVPKVLGINAQMDSDKLNVSSDKTHVGQ